MGKNKILGIKQLRTEQEERLMAPKSDMRHSTDSKSPDGDGHKKHKKHEKHKEHKKHKDHKEHKKHKKEKKEKRDKERRTSSEANPLSSLLKEMTPGASSDNSPKTVGPSWSAEPDDILPEPIPSSLAVVKEPEQNPQHDTPTNTNEDATDSEDELELPA